MLLVDCFPRSGRGARPRRGGHRIVSVEDPADPACVVRALKNAEGTFGPGTAWLFDNLTTIQDLWGPEDALALFLEHCPRLYELQTVAYWFLRKEAHDASFLARLQRTTQVVLDTSPSNGRHYLKVAKASGRNDAVGRGVEFELTDRGIAVLGRGAEPPVRNR